MSIIHLLPKPPTDNITSYELYRRKYRIFVIKTSNHEGSFTSHSTFIRFPCRLLRLLSVHPRSIASQRPSAGGHLTRCPRQEPTDSTFMFLWKRPCLWPEILIFSYSTVPIPKTTSSILPMWIWTPIHLNRNSRPLLHS